MAGFFGEDSTETTTKSQKATKQKALKVKEIEDEAIDTSNLRQIEEIESYKDLGEKLLEQFKNGKLHHATMLSGSVGIGKATFAYNLICQMVLSQFEKPEQEGLKQANLDLLQSNTHPDVFILETKTKDEIGVDEVRALLQKLSIKSTYGSKFVLVDDIGSVNTNGLNALLKTLEEPTENTFFFLINHKNTKLLDTIYSRCNEIQMHITKQSCMNILHELEPEISLDDLKKYVEMSDCSPSLASKLYALCQENTISFDAEKFTGENDLYQLLSSIWKAIYQNFKDENKNLKMLLLEKIFYYHMEQSLNKIADDKKEKFISCLSKVQKQIIDIKKWSLPVNFIQLAS